MLVPARLLRTLSSDFYLACTAEGFQAKTRGTVLRFAQELLDLLLCKVAVDVCCDQQYA